MRTQVKFKAVLYLLCIFIGAGLCTPLIGLNNALASDWPSWRGPNQTGSSSQTGLISSWSLDGDNLTLEGRFYGSFHTHRFEQSCLCHRADWNGHH